MRNILIILSLVVSISCKKENNQPTPDNPYGLPNATQTGANTFACRENGENWISRTGIFHMGGGVNKDTLFASGDKGNGNYFELLVVRIEGRIKEGKSYPIGTNTPAKIYLSSNKNCNCPNGGCDVFNSYAISGQIDITKIDISRKIISGYFKAEIPIPSCTVMSITDGRFDIRY